MFTTTTATAAASQSSIRKPLLRGSLEDFQSHYSSSSMGQNPDSKSPAIPQNPKVCVLLNLLRTDPPMGFWGRKNQASAPQWKSALGDIGGSNNLKKTDLDLIWSEEALRPAIRTYLKCALQRALTSNSIKNTKLLLDFSKDKKLECNSQSLRNLFQVGYADHDACNLFTKHETQDAKGERGVSALGLVGQAWLNTLRPPTRWIQRTIYNQEHAANECDVLFLSLLRRGLSKSVASLRLSPWFSLRGIKYFLQCEKGDHYPDCSIAVSMATLLALLPSPFDMARRKDAEIDYGYIEEYCMQVTAMLNECVLRRPKVFSFLTKNNASDELSASLKSSWILAETQLDAPIIQLLKRVPATVFKNLATAIQRHFNSAAP